MYKMDWKQLRNRRFWVMVPFYLLLIVMAVMLTSIGWLAISIEYVSKFCRKFEIAFCKKIVTPMMDWRDRGNL